MTIEEVDVAIVGGGPGGLATACAIKKTCPDLIVRVYERAPAFKRIGFTLGLMDNGANAISAIDADLGRAVVKELLNDGALEQYHPNGERYVHIPSIGSVGVGTPEISGHLPWYRLQKMLADHLPDTCVHLAHPFSELEFDSSGATLRFEGLDKEIRAKIVIGADGNQSQVRQHLLNDGLPRFLGVAVWRGQIEPPASWNHHTNLLTGYNKKNQLFLVVRLADGRLAWQAYADWPAESLDVLVSARYVDTESFGQSNIDKRERCLSKFDGWHEIVTDIISGTPPDTITEHGQFYREAEECKKWGEGCVSLMGDAAHLMTPFLGQGVNQALEDAVEIGRSIGELGPCVEALRQYEETRIPDATFVQAGSVGIAKKVFDPNKGQITGETAWKKQNLGYFRRTPKPLTGRRFTTPVGFQSIGARLMR
ncbi:hypothetical protein BSKO_07810 [Bryopsis sp. KO-2023]|nr:hypothetical protein BSKO_07810 [Bryopsis sp. KO-2023]